MNKNSKDNRIMKFLKQARRRICANFLLNLLIIYTGFGFLLALILNLMAFVFPIYDVFKISMGIIFSAILVSIIYGIIRMPGKQSAARIIDSKGLKERVTTSLELEGRDDAISELQKEDTLKCLERFSMKEKLPIHVQYNYVFVLMMLIVSFSLVCTVDSPTKGSAKTKHEMQETVKEEIEKIQDAKQEIEQLEMITAEDKSELVELLLAAEKELSQADSAEALRKARERLEKKVENALAKESMQRASEEIKEALKEVHKAENENQKDEVMSASQRAQLDEISQMMNEMTKMLHERQNLSESEQHASLDEMGDQLESRLNELTPALSKEALEMLSADLSAEEMKEAMEKLASNAGELNLSDMDTEQVQKLIEQMKVLQSGISEAASSGNSATQSGGTTSINTDKKQSDMDGMKNTEGIKESGIPNAEGNGNSGNTGKGANSSNKGDGAGSTQEDSSLDVGEYGSSGSAAHSASNTSGGKGNGNSGSTGWNYGSKNGIETEAASERSTEHIMIPNQISDLDGDLTGSAASQGNSIKTSSADGLAWSGLKIAYDKVIANYSKNAYAKIENHKVPDNMKEIVKNYFAELNR